ncbi:hypothetical protein ASF91_20720 [Rhizobium sp. Leaf155]|nr:hypothetical protein ASF91_20720 [Rhizobium sp. Leaf155]
MRSSKLGGPTMVPLDTSRLERLFARITIGLLWHKWATYLPSTHRVESAILSPNGEAFFDGLFALDAEDRDSKSLGYGSIEYEGACAKGKEAFSIWRYRIYGGLQMTGDIDAPDVISNGIGCLAASNEFFERHPFKA